MDEYGSAPSSTKKRKRVKDTPTSSQANGAKKRKRSDSLNGSAVNDMYTTTPSTTPAKRKKSTVQPNAEAGPSTQRRQIHSNTVTPESRVSTRISRPTMRKVASQTLKRDKSKALHDYDSDSDSDRTPPPGIIRRTAKKNETSTQQKAGLSQSQKPSQSSKVVKHLGAIEISSGSENDIRPPAPLRKKPKISVRPMIAVIPSDIINLCSDEDIPPKTPRKKTTQAPEDDDNVVILSSDEESRPVCAVVPSSIVANPSQAASPIATTMLYERENTKVPGPAVDDSDLQTDERSTVNTTIGSQTTGLESDLAAVDIGEPPEIVMDVKALQASYNEAYREAMLDPGGSNRNRSLRFTATSTRASAFSTSMAIRPRTVVYEKSPPTTPSRNSHTELYFARTLGFYREQLKAKAKKRLAGSFQKITAKTPIITVSANSSAMTSRPAFCATVAPTAESCGLSLQEQQNNETLPRDCPAPISVIQEDIVMQDAQDQTNQLCPDKPTFVPPPDSNSLDKVEPILVHKASNRSVAASIIEKAILDIPSTPGSRTLSVSQNEPINIGNSPIKGVSDPPVAHLRQYMEDSLEDIVPSRIGNVEIYPAPSNTGTDQTAGSSSIDDNLTYVEPEEIAKSHKLVRLLHGIMHSKKSGAGTGTIPIRPAVDKLVFPDDSAEAQLPQAVEFPQSENPIGTDQLILVADKAEAPTTETLNSQNVADCDLLNTMDISSPVADEETVVSYPVSPPYRPVSPTPPDLSVPSKINLDGLDLEATLSLSPAALEESLVEMEATAIGPASSTTSEDAVLMLEESDVISPSSSTTLADVPIMTTTTATTPGEPMTKSSTIESNENSIPPADTSASLPQTQERPTNPTMPDVLLSHNDLLNSDVTQVNSNPPILSSPTDTLKVSSLGSSSARPSSPAQRRAVPIIHAASQRLPIDLSFLGENAPNVDISSLITYDDDDDDIDLSDLELGYPEF